MSIKQDRLKTSQLFQPEERALAFKMTKTLLTWQQRHDFFTRNACFLILPCPAIGHSKLTSLARHEKQVCMSLQPSSPAEHFRAELQFLWLAETSANFKALWIIIKKLAWVLHS